MTMKLLKCNFSFVKKFLNRSLNVQLNSNLGKEIKFLNDTKEFNDKIQLFDKPKTNFAGKISQLVMTQALKVCAHLEYLRNHPLILTPLVYLNMRFDDVKQAEYLFHQSKMNVIQMHRTMMNGFNVENSPLKTKSLLKTIKDHGLQPYLAIYFCIINALTKIGDYSLCQLIIKDISSSFLNENSLQGALISMRMWGKIGCVEKSKNIFDKILHPDLVHYTTKLDTYGLNGMCPDAIHLYHRIPPDSQDEPIHICVLNACSRSGYIDAARSIFHNIQNKTEYIYASMIDCLSRATLFDADLSKKIYDHMKIIFSQMKDSFMSDAILLSNAHSSSNGIDKASELIRELSKSKIKRKVAVTWTAVNLELYEFRPHDRSHPRSSEIYEENNKISIELLEHGHIFDPSWIARPLGPNETVASVLSGHSERLAIAWNFVCNPKATRIQLTVDLRLCGDCHRSIKLIALIRQCEIIVRDANRIHRFSTDGKCSCNDYF